MKTDTSFWKAGHWPTLVSAFLYFDVSFMVWVLLGALGNHVASEFNAGLVVFSGLALLALISLVIAQRKWIGNWIAEHGRVEASATALPAREAGPA